MEKESAFSAELLRMMLSEERHKFVSALGNGALWKDLNRIRKNINQINDLLDEMNRQNDTGRSRSGDPNAR